MNQQIDELESDLYAFELEYPDMARENEVFHKLLAERRQMQERIKELERALSLAATRLEILTGRMKACHVNTGAHSLSVDEGVIFSREARAVLKEVDSEPANT